MKKRPRPSNTTVSNKKSAQGSNTVQKKTGCGCGKKRRGQ